jgi:hypothetical protein
MDQTALAVLGMIGIETNRPNGLWGGGWLAAGQAAVQTLAGADPVKHPPQLCRRGGLAEASGKSRGALAAARRK